MPRTAVQPQSLWLDEPERKKKSYFKRKMNKLRHRSQSAPRSISASFGFDHVAHIDSDISYGLDKAFHQTDISAIKIPTQDAQISIAVCDKYANKPLPRSHESTPASTQQDSASKRSSFAAYSSYRTIPTSTSCSRDLSTVATRTLSTDLLRHTSMASTSSSMVANSLFTRSSMSSPRTSACSSPMSAAGKRRSSSIACHYVRDSSIPSGLYSIPQELEAGFEDISGSASAAVSGKHCSGGSDISCLSQVLSVYGDSCLNGDSPAKLKELAEKHQLKYANYLDMAGDSEETDDETITLKKLDIKDIHTFRSSIDSSMGYEMRCKILSEYRRANKFKVKSKKSMILPSQKGVCLLKDTSEDSNSSMHSESSDQNSACSDKSSVSLNTKESSIQDILGEIGLCQSEEPESREELDGAFQSLTVCDN